MGWQWRIPLQHRTGNGYVYASDFIDEDAAHAHLLQNINGALINSPKTIRFTTGTRAQHWTKNCLALGLASGFLEPLESTSIHLIQASLLHFIEHFPNTTQFTAEQKAFNQLLNHEIECIRDFIILHYHVTSRTDSDFWNYCRSMGVPSSLQDRINLFKESAKIFTRWGDLFGEESWVQVMLGQGIMPTHCHPYTQAHTQIPNLADFLGDLRQSVAQTVKTLPLHSDFIRHYAKATP